MKAHIRPRIVMMSHSKGLVSPEDKSCCESTLQRLIHNTTQSERAVADGAVRVAWTLRLKQLQYYHNYTDSTKADH